MRSCEKQGCMINQENMFEQIDREPMIRPLVIFLLFSILIHILFLLTSTIVKVRQSVDLPQKPVSVRIIEKPKAPEKKIEDKGRVEDITSAKIEKPDTPPPILARTDSKAHSPLKGKTYKAKETIIPRQKLSPAKPALAKEKVEHPRKAAKKIKSKISAVQNKKLVPEQAKESAKIDLFSSEVMDEAFTDVEKSNREKAKKQEFAKARKLSRNLHEKNENALKGPQSKDGVKSRKGSDIDIFAKSSTGDFIDLGDEAVVSLNTKEFRFVDYFSEIKRRIELVWQYPEEAALGGESGEVTIRFSLQKSGSLIDVTIVRSTGVKVLDDEALLAIKTAAPYPPFPEGINKKRLHIVGTFVYMPSYGAYR